MESPYPDAVRQSYVAVAAAGRPVAGFMAHEPAAHEQAPAAQRG
ncbi:hypothetical protein [Streptomyces griseus]